MKETPATTRPKGKSRNGLSLNLELGGMMVRRPVATLTVTVAGVDPLGATGSGVIEQLAIRGRPLQFRAIGCENPPVAETWIVYFATWPAGTVELF